MTTPDYLANTVDPILRKKSAEVREHWANNVGPFPTGVIGPTDCVRLQKLLQEIINAHNYRAAFQHGVTEAIEIASAENSQS